VIDKESVAEAARASSAVPVVFIQVDCRGRLLVGGGVRDYIPISVARQKGADDVIAVDISESVINCNVATDTSVVITFPL
jgi:NTE family protein